MFLNHRRCDPIITANFPSGEVAFCIRGSVASPSGEVASCIWGSVDSISRAVPSSMNHSLKVDNSV